EVETAAVGADDQVVGRLIEFEVVGDNGGETVVNLRPGGAIVAGAIEAVVGAQHQETLVVGIFADDMGHVVIGQAGVNRGPGLAAVVRLEDVRMAVIHLVTVIGDVGGIGVKGRDLHLLEPSPGLEAGDVVADLVPGLAAIVGDLDDAVVGAHPDGVLIRRREGKGEDGIGGFGPGHVEIHHPARGLLFAAVVEGEVGRDGGPGVTAVDGLVQPVGAHVDGVGVAGIHLDGRGPVEAGGHVVDVGAFTR